MVTYLKNVLNGQVKAAFELTFVVFLIQILLFITTLLWLYLLK